MVWKELKKYINFYVYCKFFEDEKFVQDNHFLIS